MNHNITEYLKQLQELTNRNLEILQMINESFYTKKNHLVTTIDNVNYVIPSFLSLENKIDTLQQNLENIVNAPTSGEAATYFDGTTQKIQLLGYETFPNQIQLNPATIFDVKSNDIFKDFMTPIPFVKLDITAISNATKNVVVKKVCIKNDELLTAVQNVISNSVVNTYSDGNTNWDVIGSGNIKYTDLYKILYLYEEDKDYVEYDTTQRLPYRYGGIGGTYTINTIENNWNDSNFDEYYTLVLDNDLVYWIDNETIQQNLSIGDKLITNDNKVQLEIIDLHPLTKTITVKVLYGGYANLTTTGSNNPDLYTLKFFSSPNFNDIKYAEVPLEEDKYVCVFVAPINDSLNAQSAWGIGIYINCDELRDINGTKFRDYYNANVNNIGDTLFDITQMVNSSLTNLTEGEWNSVVETKPVLDSKDLIVTQINKHLNDSATVQQIRSLYDQKNKYKSDLDVVQRNIDNINSTLSSLSFDDTTNSRSLYTSQLAELNSDKINLTNSIYAISEEMANIANSADIPLENAKYHIRGFVNIPAAITFNSNNISANVIKIDVEYRYKNANKFSGNAETIGNDSIYSDWNKMDSFYNRKHPSINSNGSYSFTYDPSNDNINEPSFNQIDIPISQGESVDIRVRFVYDLGFPFVETLTEWSDILNVAFPEEYTKNVDVLQIVDENNNDLKNNYFSSTLNKIGVTAHVDDKIEDQNITYFHSPDHISSGFYTPERRIVPLYDKLNEMVEEINNLKTEVLGQQSENLVVYIADNKNSQQLQPYVNNTFVTQDFINNPNMIVYDSGVENIAKILQSNVAYMQLNINIYNAGTYNMKLYSMFPGSNELTPTTQSPFNPMNYIYQPSTSGQQDPERGVWMQLDGSSNAGNAIPQQCNQFMYFRVNDPFTASNYYLTETPTNELNLSNVIINAASTTAISKIPSNRGAITRDLSPSNLSTYFSGSFDPLNANGKYVYGSLYPYIGQKSNICINPDENFITIKAGESITVPLSFYYAFMVYGSSIPTNVKFDAITREIAFDIRTSLYKDPITYRLKVSANYLDAKDLKVKKEDATMKIAGKSAPLIYSPVINR